MGSDGIFFEEGIIHPRVYGSAAGSCGPCVREWKLFSLEYAVYTERGPATLRPPQSRYDWPRFLSDLVVFDPATVEDRAQYAVLINNPGHWFTCWLRVPIVANGKPLEHLDAPLPRPRHSVRSAFTGKPGVSRPLDWTSLQMKQSKESDCDSVDANTPKGRDISSVGAAPRIFGVKSFMAIDAIFAMR